MRFVLLFALSILVTHCNYSQKKDKAEFEATILSDAAHCGLTSGLFKTLTKEQKQLVSALTS